MAEQTLPRTVELIGDANGFVRVLDQTRLPAELTFCDCTTVQDVWESIRSLRVRGAPAIGVAAAYGVLLGLRTYSGSPKLLGAKLRAGASHLRSSRPTAVNLFAALSRMERCFEEATAEGLAADQL